MSPLNKNIQARGPHICLEQLIQLRHAAKNIQLLSNKSAQGTANGSYHSSFRGRGMDFEEVRIYQTGDDIRNIDWRVTARTTIPHTKIFREEKERPVLIALDLRHSMLFGSKITYKSIIASELAALISWSSLNEHNRVGGIIFNEKKHRDIKPKNSKNSILSLLKSIVDYHEMLFSKNELGDITLNNALEKVLHTAKPGSAVFIISDFNGHNEETERLLHLIKRHTDLYALVISDLLEENIPSHKNLCLTNGDKKIYLDTTNRKVSDLYRKQFLDRYNHLQHIFNKTGIIQKNIWTHDDPVFSLMAINSEKIRGGIKTSRGINAHAD